MFPQFQAALDELATLEKLAEKGGAGPEVTARSQKLAQQIMEIRNNPLMLKPENAAEFRQFTARLKIVLTSKPALPGRPSTRAGQKRAVALEGWLKILTKTTGISVASKRYIKQTGERWESLLMFYSDKDLLKPDFYNLHCGQFELEEMVDVQFDKHDPLKFNLLFEKEKRGEVHTTTHSFMTETEADTQRWVNGLKEWRLRDLAIGDPHVFSESALVQEMRDHKNDEDAVARILNLSGLCDLAVFMEDEAKDMKEDEEQQRKKREERERLAAERQKERQQREEARKEREGQVTVEVADIDPIEKKKKKDGFVEKSIDVSKDMTVMSLHVLTLGLTAVAGVNKDNLFGQQSEEGTEEPPKVPSNETTGQKALEVTKDIAMVSLHAMTFGLTAVAGLGKEDLFGGKAHNVQVEEVEEEDPKDSYLASKTLTELILKEESLQESITEIEPRINLREKELSQAKCEYDHVVQQIEKDVEFRNDYASLYEWKEDQFNETQVLDQALSHCKIQLLLFQQQYIAQTTQSRQQQRHIDQVAQAVNDKKAQLQRLTAQLEENTIRNCELKNRLKYLQALSNGHTDLESIQMQLENEKDATISHRTQHSLMSQEYRKLVEKNEQQLQYHDQTIQELREKLCHLREKHHTLKKSTYQKAHPPSPILALEGFSAPGANEDGQPTYETQMDLTDSLHQLRKQYFTSLGFRCKLMFTMHQGVSPSVLIEDLYNQATSQNIPSSEWAQWLPIAMQAQSNAALSEKPDSTQETPNAPVKQGQLITSRKDGPTYVGGLSLVPEVPTSALPLPDLYQTEQTKFPNNSEGRAVPSKPPKKKKRVVRVAVIK